MDNSEQVWKIDPESMKMYEFFDTMLETLTAGAIMRGATIPDTIPVYVFRKWCLDNNGEELYINWRAHHEDSIFKPMVYRVGIRANGGYSLGNMRLGTIRQYLGRCE